MYGFSAKSTIAPLNIPSIINKIYKWVILPQYWTPYPQYTLSIEISIQLLQYDLLVVDSFLLSLAIVYVPKESSPSEAFFFLEYELIVPLFFIMWKLYFLTAIIQNHVTLFIYLTSN